MAIQSQQQELAVQGRLSGQGNTGYPKIFGTPPMWLFPSLFYILANKEIVYFALSTHAIVIGN